jgi:hypothetical protein
MDLRIQAGEAGRRSRVGRECATVVGPHPKGQKFAIQYRRLDQCFSHHWDHRNPSELAALHQMRETILPHKR